MVFRKNKKLQIPNVLSDIIADLRKYKFGFFLGGSLVHFFISTIGLGALLVIFRIILSFAGINNLTNENFWSLFSNPISLFFCLAYILTAAFLIFVEFSTLITIIDARKSGGKISWRTIVRESFHRIKMLAGWQILFFVLYFILMIPLGNIGVSSALNRGLYIPKFISGEVMKTQSGAIFYTSVLAFVLYVNFRLILVLPLSVLNRNKIWQNIKISWQKTKKQGLNILGSIAILEAFLFVVASLVIFLVTAAFSVFSFSGTVSQIIFYTIIDSVIFAFSVLFKVILVDILLIFIRRNNIVSNPEVRTGNEFRHSKKLAFFATFLLICGLLANGIQLKFMTLNEKIVKIAHRGDVSGGVENSIEALESAKKKGAEMAEIDIQLTKDGRFVVVHDYNLKRLSGENLQVRDLDFGQIVGKNIFANGKSSKISSFDEFVDFAKSNNIDLLIEIKPNGGEPDDFYRIFSDKVRSLGISEKFRVMSLDISLMKKIENYAPEIKTGAVIPFQLGLFEDSEIDFYVIEDFSCNNFKTEEAKSRGKEVFVWTINSEEAISKYLQSPVDGIITDELELVDKIKDNIKNQNSYFDKLRQFITLKTGIVL